MTDWLATVVDVAVGRDEFVAVAVGKGVGVLVGKAWPVGVEVGKRVLVGEAAGVAVCVGVRVVTVLPWHVCDPESVNVLPASGTNCQS